MSAIQFNVLKVVGKAFLSYGSGIKNFSFEKDVLEKKNPEKTVYDIVIFDKPTFKSLYLSLPLKNFIEHIDEIANFKNLFVCSPDKLLDEELVLYYQTKDDKRLHELEENISWRIEVLRDQIKKSK